MFKISMQYINYNCHVYQILYFSFSFLLLILSILIFSNNTKINYFQQNIFIKTFAIRNEKFMHTIFCLNHNW